MMLVTVCKHQPSEKCFYVPALFDWSSDGRSAPILKIESQVLRCYNGFMHVHRERAIFIWETMMIIVLAEIKT